MATRATATAYLGIGTNLGDRLAYLQGAVDGLRAHPHIEVVGISRVYETAPVGGPEQGRFLNAAIAVQTSLDPMALLGVANKLEADAERVREIRWGPRTLDVDVLLYDDVVLDGPVLTIPHPRMFERSFVLIPLADVAPSLVGAVAHDPDVMLTNLVLQ